MNPLQEIRGPAASAHLKQKNKFYLTFAGAGSLRLADLFQETEHK